MRLLVISNLYPYKTNKFFGIFTARQFGMAARLGVDVTIVFAYIWIPKVIQKLSSNYRDFDANHMPIDTPGIKVLPIRCPRYTRGMGGYRWDGLSIYYSARRLITRLHAEKPFDVIYGKGIFPSADAGVRFKKVLGVPVVGEGVGSDVHVAPDYSPGMYRHFVRTVSALDGAVADGKGVADRLISVMNMEVPTVHGLVDMDVFKPLHDRRDVRRELNLATDAMVLLFVGNLRREKGLYELIEAFSRIRKQVPNAVLRICGQGPERAGLEQAIHRHGLSDSIQMVGAVMPERMHLWMQACDVFSLPSYSEGMPNVVMEAMACGVPMITTTVGGLPDAVGDSAGAILVSPKQVEPLTDAILRVCLDPSLRREMSLAARSTAEQRFSLRANVEKTLAHVKKTIDKASKAPMG